MTKQDLLEFYGTSAYRYDFECPDGKWCDDLLATRKSLLYHLQQEILDNLRDEVFKELAHGIDGVLSGERKTHKHGQLASYCAIDPSDLYDKALDDLRDEMGYLCSGDYKKAEKVVQKVSDGLVADALMARDILLRDVRCAAGWAAAARAFGAPIWDVDYGGEAWYGIAKGAEMLAKAKRIDDIWVNIDRIFSLMHNNSAVSDDFPSAERFWLHDCLEAKCRLEEGWFYNLRIPSVFKGEHAGRGDTVYYPLLTNYAGDGEGLVGGIVDYLQDRVWSYAQTSRAYHAHSRWVLSGHHPGIRATFRKILAEKLHRCVPAIAIELKGLSAEDHQEVAQAINAYVNDHKSLRLGGSDEAPSITVTSNMSYIVKTLKSVLMQIRDSMGVEK